MICNVDLVTDECQCENNGYCNSGYCMCTPPLGGYFCELNLCDKKHTLTYDKVNNTCVCKSGWKGVFCDELGTVQPLFNLHATFYNLDVLINCSLSRRWIRCSEQLVQMLPWLFGERLFETGPVPLYQRRSVPAERVWILYRLHLPFRMDWQPMWKEGLWLCRLSHCLLRH